MMLQFVTEKLEPTQEDDLADETVYYLRRILVEQAKAGILGWSVVLDVAMAGLKLGEKFPEAEIKLIEAMGEAAQNLKDHPGFETDRMLKPAYQELISRIRQQWRPSPGDDNALYSEAVKKVLAELGEPESPTTRAEG